MSEYNIDEDDAMYNYNLPIPLTEVIINILYCN